MNGFWLFTVRRGPAGGRSVEQTLRKNDSQRRGSNSIAHVVVDGSAAVPDVAELLRWLAGELERKEERRRRTS